jgi:hypothetical protein
MKELNVREGLQEMALQVLKDWYKSEKRQSIGLDLLICFDDSDSTTVAKVIAGM